MSKTGCAGKIPSPLFDILCSKLKREREREQIRLFLSGSSALNPSPSGL